VSTDSLQATLHHGSAIRLVWSAEPKEPRQVFLEAILGDSLWYRGDEDGPLQGTDCARLLRVDVSRGQHGHSSLGALIGGVAGVAIAAIAAQPEPNPGPLDYGSEIANTATPFLAALGGVALGALVGSQIRTHTWQSTPPCTGTPVAPIEPGDSLRVHLRDAPSFLMGRFVLDSVGTLHLQVEGEAVERELTPGDIERIDRREPGERRTVRGALAGGLIGGILGAALGPWAMGGQGEAGRINALEGFALGAAAGAILGMLTGRNERSETWRPIPIDQLTRMGMMASLDETPPPLLAQSRVLHWEWRLAQYKW